MRFLIITSPEINMGQVLLEEIFLWAQRLCASNSLEKQNSWWVFFSSFSKGRNYKKNQFFLRKRNLRFSLSEKSTRSFQLPIFSKISFKNSHKILLIRCELFAGMKILEPKNLSKIQHNHLKPSQNSLFKMKISLNFEWLQTWDWAFLFNLWTWFLPTFKFPTPFT